MSPSNGRPSEILLSESIPGKSSSNNNKREPEHLEKEKSYKIAKLSESGQKYEKENVDPRSSSNVSKFGSFVVTLSMTYYICRVCPEEEVLYL